MFLLALTLISYKEEFERYQKHIQHLQTQREGEKQQAIERGATRDEEETSWVHASNERQLAEEEFHLVSCGINGITGYTPEMAEATLAARAAEAVHEVDAAGLILIAKAISKATDFCKEIWNIDNQVIAAVEKVVLRNRERPGAGKPSISEVYAEIPKNRRSAAQKAIRRLGFSSFFTPDPRAKKSD